MSLDVHKSLAQKARTDFAGYARHCLKIKTKEGKIEPFTLNKPQKYVLSRIMKMHREGRPIRIIILKARQQGMTTFSQGWLAWQAFTREGQNCLCIAQSLDAAGQIFEKVETMHDLLPEWARVEKDTKTRGKKLTLSAPLHSLLYVESAENRDAGRSGTFRHVHATEIPLWPDAKRTMDGLMQCVPNDPGTSIIVESTAKGMGDSFHKMWVDAVEGRNGFEPIFLPWYFLDEYERETQPYDEKLPDWIVELGETLDLPDRKLRWYADKLRDLGGDRDVLAQEYPSTADEAFLTSGRPFFHPNSIGHYRKIVADSKPLRQGMYRVRNGKTRFVDEEDGDLHIYKLPVKKHGYVVAADIATGRAFDFSAIQVLGPGLEQVASYKGKIEPDLLADLMATIGKVYNNALLVPERNGVGLATVLKLTNDIGYSNVYTHKRLDTTTGSESVDYGWTTTNRNRGPMLEELAAVVRTGEIKIHDPRTVREMETFVFADELGKRAEANPGSNDDAIFALAIAVSVSEYAGDGQVYYEQDDSNLEF